MRDIVRTSQRFRRDAKARGSKARLDVARRYARILAGVRKDAERLERRVQTLTRNGVRPSPLLIQMLEEHQVLKRNLANELLSAVDSVFDVADRETRRETLEALKDAKALVDLRRAGSGLAPVDQQAILNLIGATDRGPLKDRLRRLAGRDADQVAQQIVDGYARGRSYDEIADQIEQTVGGSSRAVALRIVRTETMRARREASRQLFLRTAGVRGWVWICSLTPTSCGLCWARHGHVHDLAEVMATHPNCSCEMAPWFGEDVDLGEDLFDALTPEEQDIAIGAAAGRAYRAGAITLQDLVAQRRDPQWGPVGVQRSLLNVLGPAAGEFYAA